ncbi:MAG: hypothetical protein IJO73_06310 [Clostridia bacterium]|nr:hypothetical protein [Clostridia bacterium]
MKKLISVLLAVLMLFSVMSISASAAYLNGDSIDDYIDANLDDDHFVAFFDCGPFATKTRINLYDSQTGKFETIENGHTGSFYLVPMNADHMRVGYEFTLPNLLDTDTEDFDGWRSNAFDYVLAGGQTVTITQEMLDDDGIIRFTTVRSASAPTEDTMATVVNILCKIFGAIYGLLFLNGDTEQGVAFVQELLGGILG